MIQNPKLAYQDPKVPKPSLASKDTLTFKSSRSSSRGGTAKGNEQDIYNAYVSNYDKQSFSEARRIMNDESSIGSTNKFRYSNRLFQPITGDQNKNDQ